MSQENQDGDERPKIFLEEGRPLRFAFHRSIQNVGAIQRLRQDIQVCSLSLCLKGVTEFRQNYAGEVKDDDSEADVVLCNEKRPNGKRERLQAGYNTHSDEAKRKIWVESMDYVQRCIRHGTRLSHERRKQRMPGIPPGSIKMEFTQEDDTNLCEYLAIVTPSSDDGGRQGIGTYSDMVNKIEVDPKSVWVRRHSAESWRSYYKRNKGRLDARIQKLVENSVPNEKLMYKTARRRNYQGPQVLVDEENEAEADEAEVGLASDQQLQATPTGSQRRTPRRRVADPDDEDEDDYHDANSLFSEPEENQDQQHPDDPSEFLKLDVQHPSSPRIRPTSRHAPTSQPEASSSRTRGQTSVLANVPRPSSPVGRDENVFVPATPSQESHEILVPSTSQQASQPQAAKNTRKPRRPTVPEVPSPAPYRNTRSRSRSVEPQRTMVASASGRNRGRPRKATRGRTRTPSVEPDEVDVNALAPPTLNLDDITEVDESDYPTGPEQFEDVPVHANAPSVPGPSIPRPTRKRGREIPIDDRQIRRRLNAANRSSVVDPGQILRNITTPRLATARERAPSPSTIRTSGPPLRQELANLPAQIVERQPEAGPSMPSRHRRQPSSIVQGGPGSRQQTESEVGHSGGRERRLSDSGSDEFPYPGTKAYDMAQKIKEQEKLTPYKPPAGTRAGAAEQKRTRRRQ
ncbi:hypothetical protein D9758_000893 [Tetrapyrgos nigripes]|uniref:Rap1 Myb domain-containing protein n=1 Tax=Tetrapyrgos nigripes TaxID=182062 RepID=A0A8H5GZ74_9AGAR|nr:hypothetical protein D9758_000893 [Tetrapyrgos nigripes]